MEQLLTQVRNGVRLLEEKLPSVEDPIPAMTKRLRIFIGGLFYYSISPVYLVYCVYCGYFVFNSIFYTAVVATLRITITTFP